MRKNIFKNIKNATTETDIQSEFEECLKSFFNEAKLEHIYGCDGFLQADVIQDGEMRLLKLITEYKLDINLKTDRGKSIVLIQVLYYLKKFEDRDGSIPNVILVADKNDVFVMHTNDIVQYLDRDLDWNVNPSNAYKHNDKLLQEMMCDEKINQVFVFEINENFKFEDVAKKINELNFNIKKYIRANENNLSIVFDTFINRVIVEKENIPSNKLVKIFMDLIVHGHEAHINDNRKNTLILSDGSKVKIDYDSYMSFFNYYERDYKPSEKYRFTEISDRLIEDIERRRKGEFYTPTIWVNEAHKMISDEVGDDWKEEYIVWDCSWGTGNLTRDYRFKELYCSTLNEGDLIIGDKYNGNATKFQYDFLNDDIDTLETLKDVKTLKGCIEESDIKKTLLYKNAPDLVRAMLERKKIMFFINPPYGAAKSGGAKLGNTKAGLTNTSISNVMKKNNMGYATRQLFLQFMYRCYSIKELFELDMKIAIFHPSAFYTYTEYSKCRNLILDNYKYMNSFFIKASQFSDVAENWGICFSILGGDIEKSIVSRVKDKNGEVVFDIKNKHFYSMEGGLKASDWCRELLDKNKSKDTVYLKTPLGVGNTERENAIVKRGFLGGFWCNSNIVEKNNQFVSLGSAMYGYPACFCITESTYKRVISLFTARKLISGTYSTWLNSKDEYMIPNTKHNKYQQWENDCIVYSLFNTSSNQSSLRNIEYGNKNWDIENEFFFMSVDKIKELSDRTEEDGGNTDVFNDIIAFGKDRYVYKLLKIVNLSEDAQSVLEKAQQLTIDSFKHRDKFNQKYPEYQINTWDAGWYQIRALLKEYMPSEFDKFNQLYKALSDRMRPLVYELGFLEIER